MLLHDKKYYIDELVCNIATYYTLRNIYIGIMFDFV